MQPLNQPERRTRLWQFALLYLLALAVPLGASYYLFSNASLADENARLKHELDRTQQEQQQLVTRFDTLTHSLRRVGAVDQRLLAESNDAVRSSLNVANQDNLNYLAGVLGQLRVDSAALQVPAHRGLVRDELRAFDLFRASRSTIDELRQRLTDSGRDNRQLGQRENELGQAKQQVIALQGQVAMLQSALNSRGSGGGSGGGAPAVVPVPSAGAKQQVALLQDQLAFANADCIRQRAIMTKSHKDRKRLLEEARTAFITILQDPATDDLKASIEKTIEPINVELGRPPRFFGLINP